MKAIFGFCPCFCFPLCIFIASRLTRSGLGAHGHKPGQPAHPAGGGGFQAGGRRSADAGAEGGLRRDTLQRPGQRGHLRHGVEEPGAAGDAGLAAGDRAGAVVGGAGQRGDGGIWRAFGEQRPAGGVRLAVRHAQHRAARRCWASSTTRRPAKTWRARWRTGSPTTSSPAGRRHQRHRRDQDLFCEQPQRIERDLGDGLRRAKPAPDHAPGQHFALSTHLTG